MGADTGGEWEEGIRRCGALEVLKAWCEVRIGRTPGPSDVAEERMRPCRARWGHDLSMGRKSPREIRLAPRPSHRGPHPADEPARPLRSAPHTLSGGLEAQSSSPIVLRRAP